MPWQEALMRYGIRELRSRERSPAVIQGSSQ